MDLLIYCTVRAAVALLNLLPLRGRIVLIAIVFRVFLFFSARYRAIAHTNLALAFPEKDAAWRERVLREHCRSLARVIVDFARLPQLDEEWALSHIEFNELAQYRAVQRNASGKGALLVTGHLGSFELMPFYMAACESPIAFVVRNFKHKRIDDWWNRVRSARGNVVIPRKGALKGILKSLEQGVNVGVLFDQNVRRENAVFVNWFGKPASTTKAVGLAALRLKTPVLVFTIKSLGNDRYRLIMREVDCRDLYHDTERDKESRILELTHRCVFVFEDLIRDDPAGWFWLHRRWKTQPDENAPEDLYRLAQAR